MKRYKKGRARELLDKSDSILKKLKWNEAVTVLTAALTKAIWQEGGQREDARATIDIVHHVICAEIDCWSALEVRKRPTNVTPLRRNKSYFKG
jgi:hypothetical protein